MPCWVQFICIIDLVAMEFNNVPYFVVTSSLSPHLPTSTPEKAKSMNFHLSNTYIQSWNTTIRASSEMFSDLSMPSWESQVLYFLVHDRPFSLYPPPSLLLGQGAEGNIHPLSPVLLKAARERTFTLQDIWSVKFGTQWYLEIIQVPWLAQ